MADPTKGIAKKTDDVAVAAIVMRNRNSKDNEVQQINDADPANDTTVSSKMTMKEALQLVESARALQKKGGELKADEREIVKEVTAAEKIMAQEIGSAKPADSLGSPSAPARAAPKQR